MASAEEENYIRIALLLTGIAPRAVRHYFDTEFDPSYLERTIRHGRNTLMDLKKNRVINQSQWNLLFPITGIPDSTTFDVTLMITLLRNLAYIVVPNHIPVATDSSIGAALGRIRYHRNQFMNLKDARIERTVFESLWTTISEAVKTLGGTSLYDDTKELKTMILDRSNKEEMEELKKKVNELEQKLLNEPFPSNISEQEIYRNPVPLNMREYPSAIYRMNEDSRKLYRKALEVGYETKREIRVIVVGRKGAGKTCLTRRLRSQSIDDVTDTNGIDIHSVICKDNNPSDTRWHDRTQTADSRLLSCTKLTEAETQNETERSETIYDRTQHHDIRQIEETDTRADIQTEGSVPNSATAETSTNYHDQDDLMNQDIKDMTSAKENEPDDIRISVWDFGGDVEFYFTHQLFLAEDVVFIIVTSLEDPAVCSDKEFGFWFETIHCLCKNTDRDQLKPRCIIVGTKKDLCQNEEEAENVLGVRLESVPNALLKHIHGRCFLISNKESYDKAINDIKATIIQVAKESTEWETKHPMKFILLDKALDKERSNRQIITRSDIQGINNSLHQPLSPDELELYLRYNHLAGHLIYYEGIPEYIVIVPQWLSNLFRCIVTADKFRPSKLPQHDLRKLRSTGQIAEALIKDIFQIMQVKDELQSYLLRVLEKFHIVIQIPCLTEDRAIKYFAPCMVRDKEFDGNIFSREIEEKSTWLCLDCDFLPPFLFNHIIIFFCEKYVCAMGRDGLPLLYSNGAVFYISTNRCEQLVILKHKNLIQLQIMLLGQPKCRQYSEIKMLLAGKIAEFISTFSMTITYKYKWKCPESSITGSALMELNACREDEEYYCTDHEQKHIFHNYWDEDIQPILEATHKTPLKQEELNFTRLAMLVTEVIADALYDLLPGKKTETRNQCDVTSLYQKHRNLNIHVPSSGRWGRVHAVNDIPITSTQVGDDIERCRVIRNRLNHSSHYSILDNEINNLYKIIDDILTRLYTFMRLTTTPTYMDRAKKIKQKTYQVVDRKEMEEKLKRESANIYMAETMVFNTFNCNNHQTPIADTQEESQGVLETDV